MRKMTKWGHIRPWQYRDEGTCSNCAKPRDIPGRYYCRECTNLYARLSRKKHSEMNPEELRRSNARAYANVYQRRGKIFPEPCEVCGTMEGLEKHHDDYSKPLEVRWFCRKHHIEKHNAKNHDLGN